MDHETPPDISSFIIRFVHLKQPSQSAHTEYRGSICHIQSNEEIAFTSWEDAEAFIRRFIPLDAD